MIYCAPPARTAAIKRISGGICRKRSPTALGLDPNVHFWRPKRRLRAHTYNNEAGRWSPFQIPKKRAATGCDAEYQPLFSDLQTLYADDLRRNRHKVWLACVSWQVLAGCGSRRQNRGIPVYAAGYRREKFNHFCRDDRRTDMPCGSACPIARDRALTSSLADETRIAKVKKARKFRSLSP